MRHATCGCILVDEEGTHKANRAPTPTTRMTHAVETLDRQ